MRVTSAPLAVKCRSRPVLPVLVLMRAHGDLGERAGVRGIVGPDVVNSLVVSDGEAATDGTRGH